MKNYMFMEKKIKLNTHDGSNNYLKQIEDSDKYILKTQFDFMRGGTLANGHVFIDPSGGPMLVVGDTIAGTDLKIKGIEFTKGFGWILTLGK